ncbi:hypothetical protein OG921_06115 [Aldersonia sp. NBC_00410]|uniref:hypothetical protein n=1 Tax=Aldersonia sp. NBC_00410 TaxID=2975954 RepID=UPI00224C8AED|nr:hypothetical protein [Aldersonia sp. NBC_00410]MCX5042742.1 hypothetical protein [Aldersonia sp. NBC_00410]
MGRIGSWWDAIELWVAGLPFGPQFVLLVLVLLPSSFVIARALDALLNAVLRLFGRQSEDAATQSDGPR